MRDAEPFPNSEDPVIDSESANHGRINIQPYRTKLMVDDGLSCLFFLLLLHSDRLLCVPRHMSRHRRAFHRAPCSGNACVPYHTTRHRLKHVLLHVGKPKWFRSNPNFSLLTIESHKHELLYSYPSWVVVSRSHTQLPRRSVCELAWFDQLRSLMEKNCFSPLYCG